MGRPKKIKAQDPIDQTPVQDPTPPPPSIDPQVALANALLAAVSQARGPEKKNEFNRKPNTPWTPKDGAKKLKLKRKTYQHGTTLTEAMLTNEEIDLLNKIRPGSYYDGFIRVIRRRDKGVDIDYPIKTAAQRLKLVNQFGIRNLKEMLEGIIEQGLNPKKVEIDEVD